MERPPDVRDVDNCYCSLSCVVNNAVSFLRCFETFVRIDQERARYKCIGLQTLQTRKSAVVS